MAKKLNRKNLNQMVKKHTKELDVSEHDLLLQALELYKNPNHEKYKEFMEKVNKKD